MDTITLITHCWPTDDKPGSGVWLKRAFPDAATIVISKWRGWIHGWVVARRCRLLLACWIIPAGAIAYLSGRPYILYALGLDCFWISRQPIIRWLFTPIVGKAAAIVFSSRTLQNAFEAGYGRRFRSKCRIIRLPVIAETL